MEVVEKDRSKGRSQSEKIGRIKYNQQLLKRALTEIEDVKLMLRTVVAGLGGAGMLSFKKPFIQKIACLDEVDSEILELIYESGGQGILPKDLAARLSQFKLKRHQATRRILKMNKRLEKEIGMNVAERRGWHWALTSFAFESWGESETDLRGHRKD
jgi:hypothetical protein